jgi:hypothetical protein
MNAVKLVKSAYDSAVCRFITGAVLLAGSNTAHAITTTDLTEDKSGGKTFSDIADNIDKTSKEGASLLIQLVSVGGFVVVALSIYTLWQASKDEREKPLPAIIGLFVGGLMAAVGTVMWIMKNTVIGAAATP